jgi:hypothetical protein
MMTDYTPWAIYAMRAYIARCRDDEDDDEEFTFEDEERARGLGFSEEEISSARGGRSAEEEWLRRFAALPTANQRKCVRALAAGGLLGELHQEDRSVQVGAVKDKAKPKKPTRPKTPPRAPTYDDLPDLITAKVFAHFRSSANARQLETYRRKTYQHWQRGDRTYFGPTFLLYRLGNPCKPYKSPSMLGLTRKQTIPLYRKSDLLAGWKR